ncbi:MAG: hypothetical protein QXW70_01845 [Candidatus Anstonellales archaeon]
MTYCIKCGRLTEPWDFAYYARDLMCIPCYKQYIDSVRKMRCALCAIQILPEDVVYLKKRPLCRQCYSEEIERITTTSCRGCKRIVKKYEPSHKLPQGGILCDDCFRKNAIKLRARECYRCFAPLGPNKKILGDEVLCGACYLEKVEFNSLKNKFLSTIRAILSTQTLPADAGTD